MVKMGSLKCTNTYGRMWWTIVLDSRPPCWASHTSMLVVWIWNQRSCKLPHWSVAHWAWGTLIHPTSHCSGKACQTTHSTYWWQWGPQQRSICHEFWSRVWPSSITGLFTHMGGQFYTSWSIQSSVEKRTPMGKMGQWHNSISCWTIPTTPLLHLITEGSTTKQLWALKL